MCLCVCVCVYSRVRICARACVYVCLYILLSLSLNCLQSICDTERSEEESRGGEGGHGTTYSSVTAVDDEIPEDFRAIQGGEDS